MWLIRGVGNSQSHLRSPKDAYLFEHFGGSILSAAKLYAQAVFERFMGLTILVHAVGASLKRRINEIFSSSVDCNW
jgi:hypothetical protein